MKQAKLLHAMSILLLWLILLISQQSILAQSSSAYSYLTIAPPNQVMLVVVDARSLVVMESLTLGNYESLSKSFVYNAQMKSPQGNWIALPLATNQNDELLLTNLSSDETRSLKMEAGVRIRGLRWSPNSQYLLLSVVTDQGIEYSLLYNVRDNKLLTLSEIAGGVTWYQDSQKFAVESTSCTRDIGCNVEIQVFDIVTQGIESVIDVQADLEEKLKSNGRTCYLSWSPDGRYIIYMYDCNYFVSDNPRELYIWDITADSVSRLTNFSLEMWERNEGHLSGYYAILWLDNDTLILGIHVQSFDSMVTQTIEYVVSTDKVRVISEEAVQEYDVNPSSKEIAVRSMIANDPKMLPKTGSFHVTNYNVGETLDLPAPSLGEGCDMAWSADGKYLAFTQRGDLYCGLPVKAIRFYDDATQQVSEYVLPNYDPMVTTILPLGWVQIGKLD